MAGALDGIRIIDMSNVVSGPMAVQMLADQGADVIKVEAPGGDIARFWGEIRGGVGAMFATLNRNKRSIVLNLQEPEGCDILLKLVSGADVLVQNFRPGAMDRMGLDYGTLKKHRPDLIYVSISGYGDDGPYANRRAYDAMIQTATGYAALQAGDAPDGVPDLVKNIVCDKVTSLTTAQAITAALLARERGAGGQEVKISMMEAALAFLWPDGMFNNTMVGEGGTPMPPLISLVKPSPTVDGYVTCAAVSDVEWRALTKALDRPEWGTDPKFARMMDRFSNWGEITDWIDRELASRTTDEVCRVFEREDVPFAKMNTPDNLHEDPQIRHSQSLFEKDHEHGGTMRMARPPARFKQTPSDIRYMSPMLGQHTDEILSEIGHPPDRIAAYRAAGIVE